MLKSTDWILNTLFEFNCDLSRFNYQSNGIFYYECTVNKK